MLIQIYFYMFVIYSSFFIFNKAEIAINWENGFPKLSYVFVYYLKALE